MINPELRMGCKEYVEACAFGAMQFNDDAGIRIVSNPNLSF